MRMGDECGMAARMKNPLVSVIIPIYNTAEYLCACLDSVMGQTYERLQIILIDDGSGDGCGAICDAYARKDGRFEVICNTHHGVSYSRNCGLDRARGKYIAFVDSDDTVCETYIERMVGGKHSEPRWNWWYAASTMYIKRKACEESLWGN